MPPILGFYKFVACGGPEPIMGSMPFYAMQKGTINGKPATLISIQSPFGLPGELSWIAADLSDLSF